MRGPGRVWRSVARTVARAAVADGASAARLARGRAVADGAVTSPRERIALVSPWSKTKGAAYTARCARERGLVVEVCECPAEYGATEGPR